MEKIGPDNANDVIEDQLVEHVEAVERCVDADVLAFFGPITYGVDDNIRNVVEQRQPKKTKLVVVLETSGGYIEVVQRIAETLRYHYAQVEFIVPNYALSAGTVLVMSGDAIHMDYYSMLGPIDPQVAGQDNKLVPALGYLEKYSALVKKSADGELTSAELAYLVQRFDPAQLYSYEQARELSIALLKEWLVKYKFKNWVKTESKGTKVTKAMREKRATEIAKMLNDSNHWHSHSRGITMPVLRRDLKLKVEDFGKDADLNRSVRAYYRLLRDYMIRRGHVGVLHTKDRYFPLG